MSRSDATRLGIALAIAVAIIVPIVLLSGGGGEDRANLLIQRNSSAAGEELVVSIEDPGVNTAATTGGQQRVRIECLDAQGQVVAFGEHPWPFEDDGGVGAGLPHVHQPARPQAAAATRTCRIPGTDPRLEGEVDASAPAQ